MVASKIQNCIVILIYLLNLGPWATGRVDWSPLAGLTGTRPVVDRYSITRFSTDEWKMRNQNLVNKANDSLNRSMK